MKRTNRTSLPTVPCSEEQLRAELAAYAVATYSRGYSAGTDGNLSARLPDGCFLISPSGSCLGELEPDDFVRIDAKGEMMGDAQIARPSTEYRMHLAVYAVRPDVSAVLHAHPPIAVGFTVAGQTLADSVLPEVVVGLGSIPTLPYATPTTQATADIVRDWIGDHDALLLERHGTVTVGETIREAFLRLEKVEHAAHVCLVARALGPIRSLDAAEVKRLIALREDLSHAYHANPITARGAEQPRIGQR